MKRIYAPVLVLSIFVLAIILFVLHPVISSEAAAPITLLTCCKVEQEEIE